MSHPFETTTLAGYKVGGYRGFANAQQWVTSGRYNSEAEARAAAERDDEVTHVFAEYDVARYGVIYGLRTEVVACVHQPKIVIDRNNERLLREAIALADQRREQIEQSRAECMAHEGLVADLHAESLRRGTGGAIDWPEYFRNNEIC